MTAKRFNYVLGAVRLAIDELCTNAQWDRIYSLSLRYGAAGKIEREEIRYILENSISDIIGELQK